MGILPLQLAEFVGELAGKYLENLGPNASQQLVTFFKTEKFLSGADEALLEENPWVGIIGFGIGIIVTTALASPVGEISEGIGAANAVVTIITIDTPHKGRSRVNPANGNIST